MRYAAVVTATIFVLIFGVTMSLALQPTGGFNATGTTTTTTKSTKHHKTAAKRYKGEVALVDATAKSFVVHPAKGADVTLEVNDKTKYTPKGKNWDDITVDAKVSGTYRNDGSDNWALTVYFAAERPAKTTGRR